LPVTDEIGLAMATALAAWHFARERRRLRAATASPPA